MSNSPSNPANPQPPGAVLLSTDDVIQPHIIMPTSLVVRNSTQQLEG